MEIILPQAPMLTPKAINIHTRLKARNPKGTREVERIASTSPPITFITPAYIRATIPEDTMADIRPIIIPSSRNGARINQFVAPTYFIITISSDLLNTVSLIVLDTTTVETIIKKIITTIAEI